MNFNIPFSSSFASVSFLSALITAIKLTEKTFSVTLNTIDNEHDQSCVMAAVDAVNQLLKSFKGGELQVKELADKIASASHSLLLAKVRCLMCLL